MEIINIEAQAFETMMSKFNEFTRRVDALCRQNKDKRMGKWYDSQDVCLLLDISKGTLNTLRRKGLLPYTTIERKAFYKPEDVEQLIKMIVEKPDVLNNKSK